MYMVCNGRTEATLEIERTDMCAEYLTSSFLWIFMFVSNLQSFLFGCIPLTIYNYKLEHSHQK